MPERQRQTPFEAVLAPWARERFGPLREALRSDGVDAFDRDAFLMARPTVELIHTLRPEGGLGEAMEEFIALIHASYLHWEAGERVVTVLDSQLGELLGAGPAAPGAVAQGPSAWYVQFPPRRLWGAPVAGTPSEPLDGCFVARAGPRLSVVGVFGFHPGRDGFTVVAVSGPRTRDLRREDGSPLFSPVLPGGVAAGLYSLTGMEELLELAWRGPEPQ